MLSIYCIWKTIKKSYNNNKFKISATKWNEKFELPDASYSISDTQDYFEYILKTENRVTFKTKTGYYLVPLTPETMKLLGSTKSKITKDENGENVPYLEITEAILTHSNFFNNSNQQNARVLYTFIPNKLFGQLLDILTENFIFLKTFDSESSYIEVWYKIKF